MPSVRIFQSVKDERISICVLPAVQPGQVKLQLTYSGQDPNVVIPFMLTLQDALDLCVELERATKPAGKGGRGGTW